MAPEPREASWTAPALWRFGRTAGTRRMPQNNLNLGTAGICDGWFDNMNWLVAAYKSGGGGRRKPKRRLADQWPPNPAKRLGPRLNLRFGVAKAGAMCVKLPTANASAFPDFFFPNSCLKILPTTPSLDELRALPSQPAAGKCSPSPRGRRQG